jgi:hypothetical protein
MPRGKTKQQERRKVESETRATPPRDRHDPRFDDAGGLFDEPDLAPVLQIASILGRAYLQCVVSGLRFGYKSTRTVIQGEVRLLDHFRRAEFSQDVRGQVLRGLLDEARGSLRQMSEAASQEFRHLQTELTVLQQEIRTVIDPPSYSGDDHIRRWKTKP